MRLYLIRHAQPQVAPGICYGSTDLTVAEPVQASAVAALLAVLPRNQPIFSSPAQRCAVLAQALSEALQAAPPIYDVRLAEMHFGDWEMRPWRDIPHAEVDAWRDDLAEYRPGGGENVLQVAARVQAFLQELVAAPQESAILVCHAGIIRLLLASRQKLPLPDMALHAARTPHQILYGSMTVLDL